MILMSIIIVMCTEYTYTDGNMIYDMKFTRAPLILDIF